MGNLEAAGALLSKLPTNRFGKEIVSELSNQGGSVRGIPTLCIQSIHETLKG